MPEITLWRRRCPYNANEEDMREWKERFADAAMNDRIFEHYRKKVYERLREINPSFDPAAWFDTIIKYYFNHGLSEERTVQSILELRRI